MPAKPRFELHVTYARGGMLKSNLKTDTLFATAGEGEPIASDELAEYWWGFRGHRPFVVGSIEGPGRVWIRYTLEAGPTISRWWSESDQPRGSVLVTTTMREFTTNVTDAGVSIRIRLLPKEPGEKRTSESNLDVAVRDHHRLGSTELDRAVRAAEVVGTFRLLQVSAAAESLQIPSRHSTSAELKFVTQQVWRGTDLVPGQELSALNHWGTAKDNYWFSSYGGTPMRVGDPQILFLRRANKRPWTGRWSFDYRDYALLDHTGTLVFSFLGRGLPLDQFRRAIARCAWSLSHPYKARTLGRVLHKNSGAPGRGLRVSVGSGILQTVTDSTGFFELYGIPIGHAELHVEGPCGKASSLVEFSDEFSDSLEVHVPYAAGPCR